MDSRSKTRKAGWLIALVLFVFSDTQIQAAEPALQEVNAKRVSLGLTPFKEDPKLTEAAQKEADYLARNHIRNRHTKCDFDFLPDGGAANSSGVGTYPPSYGWMTCCTREAYEFGGAAFATDETGLRYMVLFVRGGRQGSREYLWRK